MRNIFLLLLLAMLPVSIVSAQEINGYKERRFGDDITNFKCAKIKGKRFYDIFFYKEILPYEYRGKTPAGEHVFKDIERCSSSIESELQINGSKVNVQYLFYKNKLVEVFISSFERSDFTKIIAAFTAKYGERHDTSRSGIYSWSDKMNNYIYIEISDDYRKITIQIVGKGYDQIYKDYKLHISKDL